MRLQCRNNESYYLCLYICYYIVNAYEIVVPDGQRFFVMRYGDHNVLTDGQQRLLFTGEGAEREIQAGWGPVWLGLDFFRIAFKFLLESDYFGIPAGRGSTFIGFL